MSRVFRGLLQQGNSKLGSAIHVWSLPAVQTCPGRTSICSRFCYAQKSRFLLPSVRERLRWNLEQANQPGFVRRMVKEIARKGVIVLRVHVAGDFASAEYAEKWVDIFKQCPKVRFYAYTRSYRIPAIAAVLERMAALKNVRLWYSVDAETGTPDSIPAGVRLAYLQTNEEDQPEQADLLFRPRRLRATIPLPMTCPHETERGKDKGTTCGSCGKCWRE